MRIKEVLDLEQAGQNAIHLHREGIFWRAYEYSAYLFATHVRAFKVSAKFIKAVKGEVVSLGFPDGLLEDILHEVAGKGWPVHREEKQISLGTDVSLAASDFLEWKKALGPKPAELPGSTPSPSRWESVIRQLRSYPILEKSPLETQQFVLHLQKEIHGLA